jgi:hypothetical protein
LSWLLSHLNKKNFVALFEAFALFAESVVVYVAVALTGTSVASVATDIAFSKVVAFTRVAVSGRQQNF